MNVHACKRVPSPKRPLAALSIVSRLSGSLPWLPEPVSWPIRLVIPRPLPCVYGPDWYPIPGCKHAPRAGQRTARASDCILASSRQTRAPSCTSRRRALAACPRCVPRVVAPSRRALVVCHARVRAVSSPAAFVRSPPCRRRSRRARMGGRVTCLTGRPLATEEGVAQSPAARDARPVSNVTGAGIFFRVSRTCRAIACVCTCVCM